MEDTGIFGAELIATVRLIGMLAGPNAWRGFVADDSECFTCVGPAAVCDVVGAVTADNHGYRTRSPLRAMRIVAAIFFFWLEYSSVNDMGPAQDSKHTN